MDFGPSLRKLRGKGLGKETTGHPWNMRQCATPSGNLFKLCCLSTGDIDPWHALSILKDQSFSERAILINGTAHCANMMASKPGDPLPLVQARQVRLGQEAHPKMVRRAGEKAGVKNIWGLGPETLLDCYDYFVDVHWNKIIHRSPSQ